MTRHGVGEFTIAVVLAALLGWAGCAGSQFARSARGEQGSGGTQAAGAEAEQAGEAEQAEEAEPQSYLDQPACQAFDDDNMDPLHRWIRPFPLAQGGAVLVFSGATAQQMDVEAVLEMASIQGYQDFACGTSVVVWVPGVQCGGPEEELARRVEEGTTMTHTETSCFRIDEIRIRIREECARQTLPPDLCQG